MIASDPDRSRPVFIVGCTRSGTSLMARILNRHSRLFLPPEETGFAYTVLGNRRLVSRTRTVREVKRLLGWLARHRQHGQPIFAGIPVDELLAELAAKSGSRDNQKDFIDDLFGTLTGRYGKARWGDKSPIHCLFLDHLTSFYPDARIIHCVRDGRDSVASLQTKMRAGIEPSESLITSALRWKYFVNSVADFSREHPETDILTVRYEDLTVAPVRVMKQVCSHLGEEFEPEMLQVSFSNSSFQGSKHQHGIYRAVSGRWRQVFDQNEQDLLNAILWPALRRFDYCNNDDFANASHAENFRIAVTKLKMTGLIHARRALAEAGIVNLFRQATYLGH